jgi:predicted amidohydrolase YtcJ
MASLTKENLNYFLKHGFINKDNFKVRSFKIYADGALGSRGALLKQKYADLKNDKTASQQKNDYGLLLISTDSLKKVLSLLYKNDFQVCTHAIGDSANKLVLQLYAELLKPQDDKRWRIEHAQIVDTADLWYFKQYKILPSVQPTHAISDKSWAIQRLGKDRICFAYSYQSLWKQNNILPLGTDFPVEDVSPLKTFYAAVFRCDYDLKDTTVFRPEEKLTRLQTLRGMTIDAAYAAFLEKETGSIEVGKKAKFTILDFDLMTISKEKLSQYIKSQSN